MKDTDDGSRRDILIGLAVWTALIGLPLVAMIQAAVVHGGAQYIDTAVFGGFGLVVFWLLGLLVVAFFARNRTPR